MVVIDPPNRAILSGDDRIALQHRRLDGRFNRIKPERIGLLVVERDAGSLPWRDLLNEFSDDAPQAIRVALGIQRIRDIQKGAITQIDASHAKASLLKNSG